jgi:alpha-1,3-glucan synthase
MSLGTFFRIIMADLSQWFFYAVLIQNYWLAAPYGRNWLYLWSSLNAQKWEIIILVLCFFIVVWAAVLWMLGRLSKRHAWFIPIFSIGLGCPRWAQILWGTSNVGAYVPWAGGPVASALIGRGLWLWLGVLDSLQGVGKCPLLIYERRLESDFK